MFAPVENIPLLHGEAIGVTQNRERESKLAAKAFRLLGAIDGDCDDIGSGGANLIVVIAIVRQLAEAKWSPVPAIKEEHDGPAGSVSS